MKIKKAIIVETFQDNRVIGGIVLAIIFSLILYFRSGKSDDLEAALVKIKQDTAVLEQNLKSGSTLQTDLSQLDAVTKNISNRLMNPSEKIANYSYFFKLEEKTSIAMDDPKQQVVVDFADPLGGKQPVFIKYEIAGTGTFQHVLSFLYHLYTGKYFVRFTSCNISRSSILPPDQVQLNASIQILGIKD